ncbi:hypothetical protein LJC11_03410 [Bacteroidales bacterium OttesenSCG-928-I21]|nr:hypothetical protein [Bacteroidales bacterium OttesenSCG-928-I21]
MKANFTYLILLLLCSLSSFGQINDSSINVWQFEINYSFQVPGGDIADRFGVNSTIGVGLTYKLKSNWTIGVEANYLFGGNVKQDTILDNLRVNVGEIINKYGEYGTIIMSERGFYGGVKIGKLFPVGKPNKNSGIVVNVGAGLLQHKIHIENKDNNTPPVLNDYKKGYDRLTNGLALREFVGYQYLSSNKLVNFYVGFEFHQAWTQCRRDFNFDTKQKDNTKRNDFLYGIRVGWILPLYKRTPETYYYY